MTFEDLRDRWGDWSKIEHIKPQSWPNELTEIQDDLNPDEWYLLVRVPFSTEADSTLAIYKSDRIGHVGDIVYDTTER